MGAAVFYAREVGATRERPLAYALNAVSYRYAREALAPSERIRTYARDAVGDSYTREVGATIERRRAYTRDAVVRYHYARKAGAIIERTIAYARDTASYRYAREAGATIERIIAYTRDAVGNYKIICKKLIFVRSRFLNIKLLCVIYGICIIITKAYITPRGYISVVIYAREAGAFIERLIADARYAASYRYAREAIARIERTIAYARDAVRYRYAREGEPIERTSLYLGYTIGNYKIICKKLIFVRSRFFNIKLLCVMYGVPIITKAYITPRGYISVVIYAREAGATPKRRRAYALDAVTYCYAREAGAFIERIICNKLSSLFYRIYSRNIGLCIYQILAYIKHSVFPI